MWGWASNVWGVAYRSSTRVPFNFRTSVKASDSEPEPVFDVFLKTAARNDEVLHLVEKTIYVKEWRAVTSLRQTTRNYKEAAESEIICTLDSRLLAYAYGSLNDLC